MDTGIPVESEYQDDLVRDISTVTINSVASKTSSVVNSSLSRTSLAKRGSTALFSNILGTLGLRSRSNSEIGIAHLHKSDRSLHSRHSSGTGVEVSVGDFGIFGVMKGI